MALTPRQFDEWRPIPRLLVALYGLMCYRVTEWFTWNGVFAPRQVMV